jgi:hypothetical protein
VQNRSTLLFGTRFSGVGYAIGIGFNFLIVAAAQQRHQPDLTTALFNEGILLAKSLFIVALRACSSSGLCRGVGRLEVHCQPAQSS